MRSEIRRLLSRSMAMLLGRPKFHKNRVKSIEKSNY
jgi:hypothetical protein